MSTTETSTTKDHDSAASPRPAVRWGWLNWRVLSVVLGIAAAGATGWFLGRGDTAHRATPHAEMDDLDVVSAMWIFACNDDSPIITYEGVKYRLNLPADFDVKRLVRGHGDLFRPTAPTSELEAWKEELRGGPEKPPKGVPSWILALPTKEARLQIIDAITRDDVFRSQFRTELEAKRSDLTMLNWGLERLDRTRKARAESRESAERQWQMWLVFGIGVANVITTVAAASLKGKKP